MHKISGYVKTFTIKEGDKDKNKKLMLFRIDVEKLLEKYKTIWSKIENLKMVILNALQVYNDRYIKTKIKTYGDKVYNNFRVSNAPKDDVECKFFKVISIDSLLVYENNFYLQVYLDNCLYKVVNKQMKHYLDD